MLDYHRMKSWDFGEITHTYTRRDTMLYALGIGLGSDPLDPKELCFVYEKRLQALPTMASVLGWPRPSFNDPRSGADFSRQLHGEQHVKIMRTLPVEATVKACEKIVSLTDLGPAKGAIAGVSRRIVNAASGDLLAECFAVTVLRGDGGFGERSGQSDPRPPPLPATPSRPPDVETELASLRQAALVYRLSGDYNPLHADPDVARAAGFPRPILQGLCTFGMAAHAILKACCGYEPARIRSIAVRFTAPVFPGDRLRFSIWRTAPARLQFRASVDARESVVLDRGVADLDE
jgi:acyl dehydratase